MSFSAPAPTRPLMSIPQRHVSREQETRDFGLRISDCGVVGGLDAFSFRNPQSAIRISRARSAFTLVELLITIAVLGIIAAMLIPQLTSDLPERLDAAAQIVSADLDYARALAVANNSKYRVVFEPDQDRYYLEHSGTNNLLNVLPPSPFRQNDDPPNRQTTYLSRMPLPAPAVRLVGAVRMQGAGQVAADVEFNPLGGTTSTHESVVWLACGTGPSTRYLPLHVNPVTGLTEIGSLRAGLPSDVASILNVAQAPVVVE
jgi:prepilin-type N-terminal cleavage/methylation domain-containing protein